jgi:glutathione synthase/RimK-type ligase-like ATP-grasp enzyme
MGITLLLTGKNDPTSDYIEEAFTGYNKKISRICVDNNCIPKMNLNPIEKIGWIEDSNKVKIQLEKVHSIIVRRPQLPDIDKDAFTNRFFNREILYALRSLLESTNAIWMNHPDSNAYASSKPRNLRFAAELGLQIPKTLISSDPIEITHWLNHHHNCIIKSITHGLIKGEKKVKMAFTQRVPINFDIDRDLISGVPIFLQEEIKKLYDIRVTVVGKQLFAASLPSNGNIDWRSYDKSQNWQKFELPEGISNACLKLCKKLNLNFAAIDMVLDKEKIYFLEINPNGQWVWIERETGLPISKAIVDRLSEGKK